MKTIIISNEDYREVICRSEANRDFWDRMGIRFAETTDIEPSFKSFVDGYCHDFERTLDFCCGAGRNLTYLLGKSVNVYGFDFSERSVEYARTEAKRIDMNFPADDRIRVLSMYNISPHFSQIFFNTVIAYAVLYENTYNGFLIALSEADRVLAEKGILHAMMRTSEKIEPEKVEEIESGDGYRTLFHKYNKTTRIYFKKDAFISLVKSLGYSVLGTSPEFPFGSRKNATAMEFTFRKNPDNKSLEIIVKR